MKLTVKFCTLVVGMLLPVMGLAASQVTIEDAWVRALPPTQSSTAAYLTIRNSGSEVAIVRAGSSEIAQKVELHHTIEVDDMMRMEQLEELRIAPGDTLSLSPGGIHLMLLDLAKMPVAGDEVGLCLQLASGDEVCTVAPARKSAGANKVHAHHH